MRPQKFVILFCHCLHAIWCRLRYGVRALYYVPAPGKYSALWRDWLVMTVCRPFFKHLILHWHAAGLSKWLETSVQIRSRKTTFRSLGRPDVSIVLSDYNRGDAAKLLSRHIEVVHNGIADPCPEFDSRVRQQRLSRLAARRPLLKGTATAETGLLEIRVLYVAHCTRSKGIFDAAQGVLIANRMLQDAGVPCRMHLKVAGRFMSEPGEKEFNRLLRQAGAKESVEYVGFISGDEKNRLLEEADLFCFPTRYENENQPVNLIEAMAYGLPVVTTRWRSVPELMPADYPGLIEVDSPDQVARALIRMAEMDCFDQLRHHYQSRYLLERHLASLAQAIRSVEHTAVTTRRPAESTAPSR